MISSRLIEFWCFGLPAALGMGGWVDVGGGWLGGAPHMCTCMRMHAHTRAHGKHDNFMQMAASIGFLGNPWEFPMMSYMRAHACTCMHARACVHM